LNYLRADQESEVHPSRSLWATREQPTMVPTSSATARTRGKDAPAF
jgi:hypothetical protein